jgi:nitroreductase
VPQEVDGTTGIPRELADVLRGRRTIAAFRPDLPPDAIIRDAMELARWAPNHKKTEPWHIYWLGAESIQAVIDLNSRIIAAAGKPDDAAAKAKKWSQVPGWLVVTMDVSSDDFRRQEDYAACCCAIQNLQIALWSVGIGTKWSTGEVTRHPEFHKLLGIDSDRQTVVGMVWYGYPAVVPEQTRKPVDEFLRRLP